MLCNINDLAEIPSWIEQNAASRVYARSARFSYADLHSGHAEIDLVYSMAAMYYYLKMKSTHRGRPIMALDDLLDDLTADQLAALLNWLWLNQHITTRANIRAWRKAQGLNS